ncbi:MAG: hypothetical protein GX146_12740 [Myxococcales bacterium]|nr:hypothetical protein [Myxococcales bacterium]
MQRVLLWAVGMGLVIGGLVACESDDNSGRNIPVNGHNAQQPQGDSDAPPISTGSDDLYSKPNVIDPLPDQGDDGKLEMVCEDPNDPSTCYCLRLAVIGSFDSGANKNDVSAFVDWLNTKSSAIVSMHQRKPTLDAGFLSNYDIILFTFQADGMSGPFWQYSAAEAQALNTWIDQGGGVVAMTGFNGNATASEVGAINSILQPATGFSYNNDAYLDQTEPDSYCYENAVAVDWTSSTHEIAREVKRTAAFWGSSISIPDGAEVVVRKHDAGATTDIAAAALEIGEGRVFVYADEWPLFSNVWLSTSDHSNVPAEQLQYENCFDQATQMWKDPDVWFQHPQFWYNVIQWTAPENDCFTIDEPIIIPID